jgi:protein O-mannosyl-transferase
LRAILAILLLALAAFGFALQAPFHLDDFSLFNNPSITDSAGWKDVFRLDQTRPLTWLTYWANYQLAGASPVSWHAFDLLLHLLTTWLVFDCLRRILPREAALVASAVFAIHPIQTESVVYVFARGTELATLFSLLVLREWLRGRHWIAVLWFIPALLAKEECVSLPLFLGLLHLSISRNRREFAPIGVMLLLSLAAGLRVLFALSVTPGAYAGQNIAISPLAYLGAQGYAILRYLQLLIVPYGFTIDPEIPLAPQWWAWLILIGLIALSFRYFRAAGAGFWFLGGLVLLLPSSSIFPAIDLAADRRVYLPLMAFAASIALLLKRVPRPVLAGVAVALVAISYSRVNVWSSNEALWREAMYRAPNKIRPRIQLARHLETYEALRLLGDTKKIAARDPQVASELGRVLLEAGRPAEALQEFGLALAENPSSPQHLTNRGVALAALGQHQAAADDFVRALSKDECFFEANLNLRRIKDSRVVIPIDLPPTTRREPCRYTPDQKRALLAEEPK